MLYRAVSYVVMSILLQRCQEWLETHFQCSKALLAPSCTAYLEITAILLDIKSGDEVYHAKFYLCFYR